jgi:hypothetical protein
MFTRRDTLYLYASVIAPADTERVEALAKDLAVREAVHVSVHAPIWGFGGLDSTLPTALRGTGQPEEGDFESEDSASDARYQTLDSDGRAAWQDSVEAARQVFQLRLDSLRKIEEGIWESWPADRRKEWLARWKQKRRGGQGLDCFKSP